MINECNSDLTHAELVSYTALHLRERGQRVRTEFELKNRRIADVLAIDRYGTITIYECKVTLRGWEQQQAQAKYLDWCHRLAIVVNVGTYRPPEPQTLNLSEPAIGSRLGLIEVDRLGTITLVNPPVRPMDDERSRWVLDAVAKAPAGMHWLRGRLVAMRR